jgi:predicted O-methyltransferase YrrM
MADDLWAAVDDYITDALIPSDSVLEAALRDSAVAGLPSINVTPAQGKFLHLIARMIASRAILEIGTLGGYSTIWLARALPPGGRLITLEYEPRHADVARANIARAGLSHVVEIRVGPAIESLPRLAAEGRGPFDLIFIDADKESTAEYFSWSLALARRGSVIIIDNVVRDGAIVDPTDDDPRVVGVRRGFERMARERRVSSTALQTVGSKGYDGFAIALMVED